MQFLFDGAILNSSQLGGWQLIAFQSLVLFFFHHPFLHTQIQAASLPYVSFLSSIEGVSKMQFNSWTAGDQTVSEISLV